MGIELTLTQALLLLGAAVLVAVVGACATRVPHAGRLGAAAASAEANCWLVPDSIRLCTSCSLSVWGAAATSLASEAA